MINPTDDLREVLERGEALGAAPVGEVIEGQRRFDLVVRLPDEIRLDTAQIERLLVENPTYNVEASLMAGQDIVGATIVFMEGDVK